MAKLLVLCIVLIVSTMAVSSKNTTTVPSTSKVIPSSHSAHSSTPAPSSSSMHSLSPSPSSSPSPITSHSASPTPTPHSSPAPTKSVTPAMSSSASPTSHPNASSPSPSASPTSHPNGSSPSPSASPIHPNSTSHVSPTPSSSAAPHSSKAPTLPPTPAPHYTKFDVMDPKTNKSCIMVAGVFKFTVKYQMMSADKKKHPMGTAMFYIAMTNETSVSGSCAKNAKNGDSIAMISVNSNHATFTWSFSVAKDNTWTTSNMTLNVTTNGNKHFTNATEAYIYSFADKKSSNTKPFTASKGHSYLCNTAEVVKLTKEVKLDVSYLRVQPVEGKSDKFNTADECASDKKPAKKDKKNNVVPIAVGCALAGLIVIVLIAYLIGRRKTNRGYQQV
eukprot:Seg1074.9 transcript_id=Seg1074.9/GoldUCD/mRNA.D3Y31 product="Lysosome-associated membrane glycoprotein 1" protein_id=Seg1074.9/GoldUCD/D3Y31